MPAGPTRLATCWFACRPAPAEDQALIHPPLELLCTVDEESGLTGASSLEPGFFSGRVLINLDSEDEGVFTIGCAGGRESTMVLPLGYAPFPASGLLFELKVSGMQGGHSGVNINERRANANVLLAALHGLAQIRLAAISGGSAHNAIAREASARFAGNPADEPRLIVLVSRLQDISIDGAKGVLVNISARQDTLTMAEVTEATSKIYEEVHDEANINLGVIFDDTLGEELRVTVVATGIRVAEELEPLPDKVTHLPRKPEGRTAGQPQRFDQEQRVPHVANGGNYGEPRRKPYTINIFSEEELDEPTFIRRNEN